MTALLFLGFWSKNKVNPRFYIMPSQTIFKCQECLSGVLEGKIGNVFQGGIAFRTPLEYHACNAHPPPLSRIAGSTLLSTVNTKVKGKKQKKKQKQKKNMTQRYRWGWTGNEAGNNFTE